ESVPHRGQLHRGHRVEKARRQPPKPAISQSGVGLLLEQPEPVEGCLFDRVAHQGTEQQIRDVVRQRAPDQKLHRKVVHAFGILSGVRRHRADPSMGEDGPDRAGEGLVALTRAADRRIDDVVEEQVPLVERTGATRELDRTGSVSPPQSGHRLGRGRYSRSRRFVCAHLHTFSPDSRMRAGLMRRSRSTSSHSRITGSDGSCSYPSVPRLAVPRKKYLVPGRASGRRTRGESVHSKRAARERENDRNWHVTVSGPVESAPYSVAVLRTAVIVCFSPGARVTDASRILLASTQRNCVHSP